VPRLLIVGGGLTGIAAAVETKRQSLDWTLFEAADRLGGRVATDIVDGFAIDRGFQVLLTSYPSLEEHVEALDLGRFIPGALVRIEGDKGVRWSRAIDPWRRPLDVFSIGWRHAVPPKDALRVARLRAGIHRDDPRAAGLDTRQYLQHLGMSERVMERFFVPFFGGVLLDRELSAPASFLRRLFSFFSRGDAAIPRGGMGSLPARLADGLPGHRLRLGTPVDSVEDGGLRVDGEHVKGRVLLCVEPDCAARLMGDTVGQGPGWYQTTTVYYTPDVLPKELSRPILTLSGSASVIHHIAPLSVVAPSLAPEGRHLVSVSHDGVADAGLEPQIAAELGRWFPDAGWRLVAVTPIARALPRWDGPPAPFLKLANGLWRAGDGVADRSIEGALSSGRHAVEAMV